MAIQVSGTEVISNSRALNNIASVDATTAASIQAAGVGGVDLIEFPTKVTVTTSVTLSGFPASAGWAVVTGGGGSGGRQYSSNASVRATSGGDGGKTSVYFSDLSVLNGESFTAAAGGAGYYTTSNRYGNAGGSSVLRWDGNVVTVTGGQSGASGWIPGYNDQLNNRADGTASVTSGSATLQTAAYGLADIGAGFTGELIAPASAGGSVTSGYTASLAAFGGASAGVLNGNTVSAGGSGGLEVWVTG